jgi:hypothetical protein
MNRAFKIENMIVKLMISCVLLVSVLAWGQHKTTSAPAKAAPKSAPASHAAPSHSAATHGSTPSHTTTGHTTTSGHAGTAGGSRGTTAGGARGTTAGGARGTTAGGARGTTAGGARGTTAGGARGTTAGGARGTTAGGARGTTAGGARGGATASRGNIRQPAGTHNVSLRGGGTANVRANGSVRSIDRNGMHIEHGVHGGGRVVGEHNGARVVNTGRHGGYVQRAYVTRGGHAYYSRTFYDHGHYRVGVYRGYGWGGRTYYGYYPGYWYHPGFYGWGYQPWGVSLAWGVGAWGWGGAPWYGFYGGWWNPYPVYAAPYFWLTDYLIAAQLQAAYAARAEDNADAAAAADAGGSGGGDAAPAAAAAPVALSPEVKQAIAEEVKAQLAAQQQQAQAGAGSAPAAAPAAATDTPPPALDPAQRTFVVDSDVSAVANGQECGLTGGDVITRLTDTPDADNAVSASVSATKKGDCPSGQTVSVKVDDLQEMYNHFQETLTSGMGEMAKKQGTNGMPKAPDTGTTASDVPPPQPDTTAAKTLQDQQAQADQTEAQVKQETASGGGQ